MVIATPVNSFVQCAVVTKVVMQSPMAITVAAPFGRWQVPLLSFAARCRSWSAVTTREAQDGVQLDPIRCDAALAMDPVKEADSGDRGRAGDCLVSVRRRATRRDEIGACFAHRLPKIWGCRRVARWTRELRDH